MTPEQIKQLDQDAKDYPLEQRVAALMYMEGVTYKQLLDLKVSTKVHVALHDILFGIAAMTPRLQELARQLVEPQSVWVVSYLDDDGKYGATARRTHEEARAIGSRERSWKLDEVQL